MANLEPSKRRLFGYYHCGGARAWVTIQVRVELGSLIVRLVTPANPQRRQGRVPGPTLTCRRLTSSGLAKRPLGAESGEAGAGSGA